MKKHLREISIIMIFTLVFVTALFGIGVYATGTGTDPVILTYDKATYAGTGTPAWATTSTNLSGNMICYDKLAKVASNTPQDKSATYTYTFGAVSKYYVYMWWSKFSNRATNTKVDITTGTQTFTTSVNQRDYGNGWVYIGSYDIDGITSLKISNVGANGYVVADAVKFVEVTNTAYVSTDGSDSAIGDQAHPFATLEAATQASRFYYQHSFTGDFHIYLRGGVYERSSAFTLTEADNPVNGKLYISSYQNEEVIIRGAKKITGWQLWQNGIYRTNINDAQYNSCSFDNIYEGDKHAIKARYPNEGWLSAVAMPDFNVTPIPSPAPAPDRRNFKFNDGDIPVWNNYAGAQVYIFPMFRWQCNVVPISTIDYTNKQITLANDIMSNRTNISNGDNYYIQGVLEALDNNGEFYLNNQDGYLYYKPYGNIDTANIYAPVIDRIIELKGTNANAQVKNIVIQNLNLEMSKFTNYYTVSDPNNYLYPSVTSRQGLIYLQNAASNTIQNCKLRLAGFFGIFASTGSDGNTFSGNELYDNGNSAIYLMGTLNGISSGGTQVYDNKLNVITNNYMHNCGKLVLSGGGVLLYQSGENEISHNVIRDMPRYGIFLQTYFGTYDYNTGATDRTTYKNNIMYNDVSKVDLETEDVGGINIWNSVETTIDTNRVHDIGDGHIVNGIYLDDGTVKSTVKNNIVYNIIGDSKSAALMQRSYQNSISNNIFVSASNMGYVLRNAKSWQIPNLDHSYIGNIFYASSSNNSMIDINPYDPQTVSTSDFNVFYDTSNKYKVSSITGVPNMNTWFNLENTKYDNRSLVSNPMFKDLSQGMLSLSADSPARKLGFVDIDEASIGTTDSFTFAPSEPIERVYLRNGSDYTSTNVGLNQTIQTQISGRTESGFFVPVLNSSVNYSSSNQSVATISATGEITGVTNGTADITATATINGVVKSASLKVYVGDSLNSITLSYKYSGTLATGDTRRPTLTTVSELGVESVMRDTSGVVFSSSNPNVLSVATNGDITCLSSGSAIITAQYQGHSAQTTIQTADVFREDFEPHALGDLQSGFRGFYSPNTILNAIKVEEEQGNKIITLNSLNSQGLYKGGLNLSSAFILQGKFKVECDGTRLMSLYHDSTHLTHLLLFDSGKIYVKNSTTTSGLFTTSIGDICLGAYQSGKWYDIKCVVNTDIDPLTPDTWDLYMDGNLIQSGLKLPPLSAEINAIRTLAYSNKASLDDFTINH